MHVFEVSGMRSQSCLVQYQFTLSCMQAAPAVLHHPYISIRPWHPDCMHHAPWSYARRLASCTPYHAYVHILLAYPPACVAEWQLIIFRHLHEVTHLLTLWHGGTRHMHRGHTHRGHTCVRRHAYHHYTWALACMGPPIGHMHSAQRQPINAQHHSEVRHSDVWGRHSSRSHAWSAQRKDVRDLHAMPPCPCMQARAAQAACGEGALRMCAAAALAGPALIRVRHPPPRLSFRVPIRELSCIVPCHAKRCACRDFPN